MVVTRRPLLFTTLSLYRGYSVVPLPTISIALPFGNGAGRLAEREGAEMRCYREIISMAIFRMRGAVLNIIDLISGRPEAVRCREGEVPQGGCRVEGVL
jgi:hypothetical protein